MYDKDNYIKHNEITCFTLHGRKILEAMFQYFKQN